MTTNHNLKSYAFDAIHASALALHKVGAIDNATMRQFDESCLPVPAHERPFAKWRRLTIRISAPTKPK